MQPFLISLNVSKENVEKVVKPPHIPVLKNNSHVSLASAFLEKIAMTTPIKNAPAIFIIKVFTGNSELPFIGIMPTKYRKMLPIKPPIPTAMQFNIVFPPLISKRTNINPSDAA